MALTVAEIEGEILRGGLFGRVLAKAGLDGTTADGGNLALRGALRLAMAEIGYPAANPPALEDADVFAIPSASVERVILLAKIRLIDDILLNWDRVEESFTQDKDAAKRMEDRLRTILKDLRERLTTMPVSSGVASVEVGLICEGSTLPRGVPARDVFPGYSC